MASILIDCEHAGIVNGLSGLKYLLPEDHLYLFYSDACLIGNYFLYIVIGCKFRT